MCSLCVLEAAWKERPMKFMWKKYMYASKFKDDSKTSLYLGLLVKSVVYSWISMEMYTSASVCYEAMIHLTYACISIFLYHIWTYEESEGCFCTLYLIIWGFLSSQIQCLKNFQGMKTDSFVFTLPTIARQLTTLSSQLERLRRKLTKNNDKYALNNLYLAPWFCLHNK